MRFPLSIQKLIDIFSTLPTVGPKTAERYVFYLLKQPTEELQKFALALAELKEKTTVCRICNAYAESNPCPICADAKRDSGVLCVVADSRDMLAIEATKQYNGRYFILGGVINVIEGFGPEQINAQKLTERIRKNGIKEVILAVNPDVEGETTAMYLTKMIKQLNMAGIKITRLAKGLPMGANLEYADEITLANALKYRNEL
ncbi:recombination protein RecR [Candidatus Falkowbacteria bacterium]|nr:recombination protein RecR [Candidatus Falkowbacteria bacterium]